MCHAASRIAQGFSRGSHASRGSSIDCSRLAAVRRSWIFLSLLAACDEKFPQALEPGSPPALVDSGVDASAEAGVVPKGARTLGVEVEIDSLEFPQQVAALRDAGARTTNATFVWTDVERPFDGGSDADVDAEAGTTVVFNAGFHIVSLVLGANGVRASLAVAALDATGPRLPPGLEGKPLDDDAVTSRYDVITDYVFSQIIDLELDVYLVAVDADVALGTDAAKWASFAGFVSKVAAHARPKRPNLKVGFTLSAAALAEKKDLAAAALAASDVVVVSMPASFDAIVDAAPAAKPIVVHRIGLDAGDAFGQWDRFGDRIPVVTFPAVSADLVREARARGF
jgi:hypothetical protein